jgi:hypothetical protein
MISWQLLEMFVPRARPVGEVVTPKGDHLPGILRRNVWPHARLQPTVHLISLALQE